jgi:MOSC domain-containing protein YiiM
MSYVELEGPVVRTGCVESVNVGRPRTVIHGRTQEQTGIWKEPVAGRVAVRGVHVGDDVQCDLSVHGGPDKAVYSYAQQDYAYWSRTLGRALLPGTFGENLTISGIDVSGAVVGERWSVGSAVLQVTEPRLPCFKLGIRMADARFPKRFGRKALFGAYLRILREGNVEAGDEVRLLDQPAHGVTVQEMGQMQLGDFHLAPRVLHADDLPDGWRAYTERLAVRNSGGRRSPAPDLAGGK